MCNRNIKGQLHFQSAGNLKSHKSHKSHKPLPVCMTSSSCSSSNHSTECSLSPLIHSQGVSVHTPPPFAFALAFARAYAWAKAGTFLKVFDGNTLPYQPPLPSLRRFNISCTYCCSTGPLLTHLATRQWQLINTLGVS